MKWEFKKTLKSGNVLTLTDPSMVDGDARDIMVEGTDFSVAIRLTGSETIALAKALYPRGFKEGKI